MSEFKSESDFQDFCKIDETKAQSFLNAILSSSKSRERNMPKNFLMYRAQKTYSTRVVQEQGIQIEKYVVCKPERMKPTPQYSKNGRVNRKGDLVFYAATDKQTAMAEVRPWIDGLVTIGYFKLLRDINIIDFSVTHAERRYNPILDRNSDDLDRPLTREEINKSVWQDIDKSFSIPVDAGDNESDYIPTQKIAEFIKSNGYDGIAYKSSLTANGYNIALFDIACVELIKRELFRVEGIEYKFSDDPLDEEYHNPVFTG